MTSPMVDRVIATDSALVLLASLRNKYGPLMLFQPGGGCDASSPMCYAMTDFSIGADDACLGNLDGTPFYLGYPQFDDWRNTQLIIDALDGVGGMFSLDNGTGKRFVTRSRLFSEEESELLEQTMLLHLFADVNKNTGA
jgi:uncharacterized protein